MNQIKSTFVKDFPIVDWTWRAKINICCSSERASLSSKKSSAKVNWCQILSKWSIGLFWQGLHVSKEPMRGLSSWLHLLWIHRPHFSHEISLFLTGLAHTEHGYCTGPGCKFMSPDSISRYLTLISMGGGPLWPPYSFSLISPERLELRPSNFLTFSFYLLAIRKI